MVRNKASLLGGLTCLLLLGIGGAKAATVLDSTARGVENGYYYEMWVNPTGNMDAKMTLNDGGTFSVTWTNTLNVLARKGRAFNDTTDSIKYTDLGKITVDYAANYNPQGTSYLCVYGWTTKPLVEFYIVEKYNNYDPSTGTSNLGNVTLDGSSYKLCSKQVNGQPSIEGDNSNFTQFWSVRQNARTSGVITISDHFKAWESKNLKLGKMHEISFCVEGYSCSGSATVTKNVLTIEKEPVATKYAMNVRKNSGLVITRTGDALNISNNSLFNQDYSNMSFVNPMGKIFQLENIVQNGTNMTLSTSSLPSGTYILRNGNKAVHQFVVNR
jgi:endo-1,4-beta-xylanase